MTKWHWSQGTKAIHRRKLKWNKKRENRLSSMPAGLLNWSLHIVKWFSMSIRLSWIHQSLHSRDKCYKLNFSPSAQYSQCVGFVVSLFFSKVDSSESCWMSASGVWVGKSCYSTRNSATAMHLQVDARQSWRISRSGEQTMYDTSQLDMGL